MTSEYEVSGMGCDGCVRTVTRALQQVPGIEKAEVTLNPPVAVLTLTKPVDIDDLRSAVKDAGEYDIRETVSH